MDSFEFYSKSRLPGGLGEEVNGYLRPDEILLAEAHMARGIGMAMTDMRLIVVRAGMLQTGTPTGRRSAAMALQQIRGLNMTMVSDEGQSLLIDSTDSRCPGWARSIRVDNAHVTDVFRLASVYWARAAELGLTHSVLPATAHKDLICHNCGAPHSLYNNPGSLPDSPDTETLPNISRRLRDSTKTLR